MGTPELLKNNNGAGITTHGILDVNISISVNNTTIIQVQTDTE